MSARKTLPLDHVSADRCATLWATVIQHHIAAAKRGDEESQIFLSSDGFAIAVMMGVDPRVYWDGVRDLCLS